MKMSNDVLQDIATVAARDAGYNGLVTAEFAPLSDLAIRYQRNSGFIHLIVADYCSDMPLELCRAMFDNIFPALHGSEMVIDPEVRKYFYRTEFAATYMATYIRRHIAELVDAGFSHDAPAWVQEIAASYGVTALAHLDAKVQVCRAFSTIHVPIGYSDDPMNRTIIVASCRRAIKKEIST